MQLLWHALSSLCACQRVYMCVCVHVFVHVCVHVCVCVCKLAHTYESSTIRPMCYPIRHQVSVCQRNWSAWGLMYSKIRSRLTMVCAWNLIYVHRTSRQCSTSTEAACSSSRRTTRKQRKEMWNFRLNRAVLCGSLGDGRAGALTRCSGSS